MKSWPVPAISGKSFFFRELFRISWAFESKKFLARTPRGV
jgi:hypothetical protein